LIFLQKDESFSVLTCLLIYQIVFSFLLILRIIVKKVISREAFLHPLSMQKSKTAQKSTFLSGFYWSW